MKAAVVHQFHTPLQIEEVPTPVPGYGQVAGEGSRPLVLCHTDIHAAHGDWPLKPSLPFIPGHEGVGLSSVLGVGVPGLSEGDRVQCRGSGGLAVRASCVRSGGSAVPERQATPVTRRRWFAEYVVAEAAFVGRVPGNVDPLDAAPLTCAGVTTYKAVKVSGARSSDLVAVFGIGGLGDLAVQYARIAGATVAAVDLIDAKLDVAKRLGASYTDE